LRDPTQPRWKYWDSIRTDVITLHDAIEGQGDDISEYERDHLMQLKRWLRRYRTLDPDDSVRHLVGDDGNMHVFLLAPDQDPDKLRPLLDLPSLDTTLPEGRWAWTPIPFPQLDSLGDTHQTFVSILRSHNIDDSPPFQHSIDGDVAWTELPRDVIKDDVMTRNQSDVMEARTARGLSVLQDLKRMARRRKRLGQYFVQKYRLSAETMSSFLLWADRMEQNRQDLEKLC
jgi:hypothetical protein